MPLLKDIFCAPPFLVGFPLIPTTLLVFLIILCSPLYFYLFLLAAPGSSLVPYSPILDLVTLCFKFSSLCICFYSPPKLYHERHITSHILYLYTHVFISS